MEIDGQQLDVLRLSRERDGATVIVPVEKVPTAGLRRVAERELVEEVLQLLAGPAGNVEHDWKEHHRDIHERLTIGGVLGVADVVRELYDLSQIRPPPSKERQQYDEARDLLVHEVAVSMTVPPGVAEDYIDYVLTPPAGVKLKLKPPPQPKPARWAPWRRKPRALPEELQELLAIEQRNLEVGVPGGEGAPPTEKRKPGRHKTATGERATKTEPNGHPARTQRARKPGPAQSRVGEKRRVK